ncbi:MAG: hypothetical protein ABIQ39_07125, partial [Ilumatobacteraceae bacterium]
MSKHPVMLAACTVMLVACGSAGAASVPASATVSGVGVLPGTEGTTTSDRTSVLTTGGVSTSSSGVTVLVGGPVGLRASGNRILMIGDSVLASTSSRYTNDMCNVLVPLGWQVEIDAEVGRFIDFGAKVLDDRLSAGWDAAVVFLGSNYNNDLLSYTQALDRLVRRLSPNPVVLVTVSEFDPSRIAV